MACSIFHKLFFVKPVSYTHLVNFAVTQFSFLGHIVKANGKVSIDPERTRAIREFLPPRDAKGIARFLGMINYFHKYIPHLAEIAAPLNTLRKKGVKFEWNEQRQTAFEKLKESIISVSYTHLDVYKRQVIYFLINYCT